MTINNTKTGGQNAYQFIDLVDVSAFARLLERFFQATGIPNGVVDTNGELLSMSSGENACSVFHRSQSEAADLCRDSNLELVRDLLDGCFTGRLCQNGLMDYVTPIVVEDRQLATLFLGPVLHAPPDMASFRAQALRFGFDEKTYLESIAAIPVVDKKQVDDLMVVMVEMAQMLAASSLAKLRQAELERDISVHSERTIRLRDILDFSPVAMGWSEDEDRIAYVNRQFTLLLGYTVVDLSNLETWYQLAYPDEHYRKTVVGSWRGAVAQEHQINEQPPELEADITCKDGSLRSVIVRVAWVGHRRMVSFTDITERKRMEDALRMSEAQSRDHDRLLQAVLESSSEVIVFALDCAYRYLAFNDKHRAAMQAIWGKEIAVGTNMLEVIGTHPDREKARQEFNRALSGEAFVVEDAYGDEAILRLYWQNFFAPIRGEDGSTIGLTCFVLNITERKRMEQALAQRERDFRTLAEHLPDVVVRYDRETRFVYVNTKFEAALGFRLTELRGKSPTQVPGLPDAEYFEQMVRQVAETGTEVRCENEIATLNGGMFYGLIIATPEFDNTGQMEFVQVVIRDISERRRIEQRMQAHNAMLEMVARNSDLPNILNALVQYLETEDQTSLCSIMLADIAGKHLLVGAAPSLPVFFNDAANGIEIAVGIGSCGTAAALAQRVVAEDIQTHEYWSDFRELAQTAKLRSCWSEPILSSRSKVLGTFAIYHREPRNPQPQDLERIAFATNLAAIAIENRQVHDELERQAHSDYLTGLENRRHFLSLAENELARTLRYSRQLSIVMLDVDHFKHVNDTYGHKVGDLVLKKLAELCRATLRDVDIVGRIGGEEFAVLLPETGSEHAKEAAERLRAEIASAQVKLDSGLPLRFTVSLGVTTLCENEANIDILLDQADQALYRAKNEGRNRVCIY